MNTQETNLHGTHLWKGDKYSFLKNILSRYIDIYTQVNSRAVVRSDCSVLWSKDISSKISCRQLRDFLAFQFVSF